MESEQPVFLSFSQLRTFDSCGHKWKYNYLDRLVPRIDRPKLDVGSAVHRGIAHGLLGESAQEGVQHWVEEKLERAKPPLTEEETEILHTQAAFASELADRALMEFHRAGFETVWLNHPASNEKTALIENKLQIPIDVPGWNGFKGYVDWVAREKASGFLWLVDFKVKESFTNEEAEEYNTQMAIYAYLLRKQYGLETAGSIAWQIKSTLPRAPTLNKADKWGNQKMSRALITTTWEMYEQTLIENGLDPADYIEEMKPKLESVQWFRMAKAYRNQQEIDAVWNEIVLPGAAKVTRDRSNPQFLTRNMNFFNCNGCAYKDLCLEELRGGDTEFIKKARFSVIGGKEEPAPIVEAEWTPPELLD